MLLSSGCMLCRFSSFHRDLRRQLRIQIHLQFFASLLLSNVASLLWYMLVHYDLLINDVMASTVIVRNQVTDLLIGGWLGSRVAKALDLQLAGCEFNSRPGAVE